MRTILIAALVLMLGTPAAILAQSSDLSVIEYRPTVRVSVGQSVVVHGYRGDCGALPDKAAFVPPKLTTGRLVLGKVGVRESQSCRGTTPAYAVVFIAERPGSEAIKLFGDRIRLIVR